MKRSVNRLLERQLARLLNGRSLSSREIIEQLGLGGSRNHPDLSAALGSLIDSGYAEALFQNGRRRYRRREQA